MDISDSKCSWNWILDSSPSHSSTEKKSFIPVFYILVSGLFIHSVAEVKSWGFSLISFSSSPLMHNPSASPFSFASKMYSDFCSISTAIPSSIHLGLCFHLCSSAPSVWCGQACCGPGLSPPDHFSRAYLAFSLFSVISRPVSALGPLTCSVSC